MSSRRQILISIAAIRARLLGRQKLGWLAGLAGGGVIFVLFLLARASYLNPAKIFWDFSLGLCFVVQAGLALYLGTQLFHEERGRRTLHLVLSTGTRRSDWILGNLLGLAGVLVAMNAVWFLFSGLLSQLAFGAFGPREGYLVLQAQIATSLESCLLLSLGVFLSLFLRPLLALVAGAALTALLHSVGSLERILIDPNIGRFIEGDRGLAKALWLTRLLPPLEWFDLRILVGYQDSAPWDLVARLFAVTLLWGGLFCVASTAVLDRKDL